MIECYVNKVYMYESKMIYTVFPDFDGHVLLTGGSLSLPLEGHVLLTNENNFGAVQHEYRWGCQSDYDPPSTT